MTVKMILAVDKGGSIGWSDGRLPWRIPSDLARFKQLTMNSTVVMGRKTFDSLKRPKGLPGRNNVVINTQYSSSMGEVMLGVQPRFFREAGGGALKTFIRAHQACLGCTPPDLWIVGGAQIYAQALKDNLVDEIHLSIINEVSGGDVVVPEALHDVVGFQQRQLEQGIRWLNAGSIPSNEEDEPSYNYTVLIKS